MIRSKYSAGHSAGVRALLWGLVFPALLVAYGSCTAAPGQGTQSDPTSGLALGSAPGSEPDGQAIFAQRCSKCHGTEGGGISAIVSIAGPSIQAEHDPAIVMTALEVGPSHMPSFAYILSVPEMHAVAGYVTQHIATIPLSGGNLIEGGEIFRNDCAVCHRTTVDGGALAFTGVNAPDLVHKSAPIIAGAIRWGPGPMPPFPASVINDQQLASIVQYVKFIQHPPDPGGNPIGYSGPVAEGFVGWMMVLILVVFSMWIEKGGKG